MKRVVLIACASRKVQHRAKATDLYISDLFRMSLAFAHTLRPEGMFILSGKHGLVHPDDELEPYNMTLNAMPMVEVKAWAERVFRRLQERTSVDTDHFIFLAGDKYRRFLQPRLRSTDVPMAGLGIGKQLQYLKRRLR